MALQGVAASGANAQQQSLFTNQATQSNQATQAQQSSSSGDSSGSAGTVQQQAQVSVMKSSLEMKQENTLELINSSMGIGQNIDTFA